MSRPLHWSLSILPMLAAGAVVAAPRPVLPVTMLQAPKPEMVLPGQGGRPTLALQVGHSKAVTCVAYSPDGKLLATGSDDLTARVWDTQNGQLKATMQGHTDGINTLAFLPDGRTLATGGKDHTARLWDTSSGRLKAVLAGHQDQIHQIAVSRDGKLLATASLDSTARLWDLATMKTRAVLRGHAGAVTAVRFSPNGKTLATGSMDNSVRLWDVPTAKTRKVLVGHSGVVDTLAYSADGHLLASGSFDNTARLWDAVTGKELRTLKGHTDRVVGVAFSPDGKTVASAAGDNTARLWDTKSGQVTATLQGHTDKLTAVAFTPDGGTLTTASWDGTARLWDGHTGEPKGTLKGHTTLVWSLAISPDGKSVATASYDSTARIWDTGDGSVRQVLQGNKATVNAYAFSPDGETLATGSLDYTARLWDTHGGQLRATLNGHSNWVTSLAFSPDQSTVATGSWDKSVRTWDAMKGQPKGNFSLPAAVHSVMYSPDGRLIAAGCGDGRVLMLDAATGQIRATLLGHTNWVNGVVFSADGKTLASSSYDYSVRLWDVATGRNKQMLHGYTNLVTALAFSPDGHTLATGSPDNVARLWDPITGKSKGMLYAKDNWLSGLAFGPGGKALAGRTLRGRVQLWSLATRAAVPVSDLAQLKGFPAEITQPVSTAGAAVSVHDGRDGRILATFMPMPEVAAIALDQRAGAGMAPGHQGGGEWFVATPEGYFDCSTNAAGYIKWNVNGVLYPTERYMSEFRRPDYVQQALRHEKITARPITIQDIPPAVWFAKVSGGEPGAPTVTITIDASDDKDISQVDLLVNGRPLPPTEAKPIEIAAKPIQVAAKPIQTSAKPIETSAKPIEISAKPIEISAKPIELGAKPIELGAKPIEISAKPIELGAKPIEFTAKDVDPNHKVLKEFTFKISFPPGAEDIRLVAVAHDDSNLNSGPVELLLKRQMTAPEEAVGNLYVLTAGISKYKNSDGKGFKDLAFPAIDAKAIADRFSREGKPLYNHVYTKVLQNEEATSTNIKAGFKWLDENVRPGRLDTVVIFLSGHGVSTGGKYFFATQDLDLKDIPHTSLPAGVIRDALGGQLQARAVFLFVDSCHSGGLNGRTDDLALEVGEGVFLLASSGSKEYSFEAKEWGHGAFTLALLKTLDNQTLAKDGIIHFNALTFAVPDEVAGLMKDAGRNENEQEPCVPLAARRLRVPLVAGAH